jgi:hypothetical protein
MLILFSSPRPAHAWGGRGHNTICEAAAFLVKNKELKEFLQLRPHIMGHLCNIPDIQWKNSSSPSDVKAASDPTHYLDPELLGYTPKTIPTDFAQLEKDFTGKPSALDKDQKIFSVPRQMGSVYWRVDQLMHVLADLKKDFDTAKPPQNRSEEQDDAFPFNKATYTFMTTAGIMGHFVGDAAQPFHETSDHDGYESGHGGIHWYYEELVVGYIDGDLIAKIIKNARAQKHPDWLKGTYVERMKKFGVVAYDDLDKVRKADPLTKKSEIKDEKGMKIKTPAERKGPEVAVKKMEPLIVNEMARAAMMLAQLWDEAYESVGKPPLMAYKSYKYPFNVDFIYPTYDDTPTKKEPAK